MKIVANNSIQTLYIMKKILLFFLLFSGYTIGQTDQFGAFVPLDIPMKSEMPKASVAGGFGLSAYFAPESRLPVALELKGNLGTYSNRTLQQTYEFMDGSQTRTNVTYSSNFHKVMLGSRFSTRYAMDGMELYLTPQIGFGSMRSRIYIADPQDEDDCKPLENTIVQRDNGFLYGLEAGLDIQMNKVISGTKIKDNHRMFFSVNYLSSFKSFDYINIRYMEDEVHGMTSNPPANGGVDSEGRDINTQFVNLGSNNLHDHKIAELYTSPLKYIGVQFGYVYRF